MDLIEYKFVFVEFSSHSPKIIPANSIIHFLRGLATLIEEILQMKTSYMVIQNIENSRQGKRNYLVVKKYNPKINL